MRAILFDSPGGTERLYCGEAAAPQPADDDLLIRVRAAGINRADLLQRRGHYPPPPGASPILGLEIAGEVVTPSNGWQMRERVMAVVTGGGYAELASIPRGMAMRIPEKLSFEEAAAIPEAFLTAYLNLFWLGRLQPGESVLIHAGASGVGTAAIQLARVAGAHVLATAGTEEKCEQCVQLGAAEAFNYNDGQMAARVLAATDGRGVELVLDFVGAPYWKDNLQALTTGGRLMLIGFLGGSTGALDLGPILSKSLTVAGTTLRRMPPAQKAALTSEFAAFALPHFEKGELIPVIDSIFALDEAAAAHERMENNLNIGKIILRV